MKSKLLLLVITLSFFTASLISHETHYTPIENKTTLSILTPSFKERKTAKIQLENGLQAYLISDPNTEKSAATLVVSTGSWEDPAGNPGIAHFLEHMLFLGTKKYPNESEYMRFIGEHGGKTNAFTGSDKTGYLFSVNNQALPEALDRFANFFIEPLFNPSAVDRELNAIDQEHAKNLDSDDRRESFVLKALANPAHPFHAFSSGNKNTLKSVSQATLKQWYKEHYSANRMRLEVVSALPIEELKSLVINTFSPIPNSNLPPLAVNMPLFPASLKGNMVYIEPLKNMNRLTLNWEIPADFIEKYDANPEVVLADLLKHEGSNSLLVQLKREMLADNLEAHSEKVGSNNYKFNLTIMLTDKGISNLDAVITRCFQALASLKAKEIPSYVFDEIHTISKLKYQFQPKADVYEYIMEEAFDLNSEEMETYPENSRIIRKLDSTAINNLIAHLAPHDAIYVLMIPQAKLIGASFDRREPWMDVPYTVRGIPPQTLALWKGAPLHPQINTPQPNPYIPNLNAANTHSLPKAPPLVPKMAPLLNNDNGTVYFAQDDRYGVPMISWSFEIKTPSITPKNVESHVLRDLYVKFATEALRPRIYLAAMAGLHVNIAPRDNGFAITVDGFSDKAQNLFLDLLKVKNDIHPLPHEFQAFKQNLIKMYKDMSYMSPIAQGVDMLRSVQYKDHISLEALSAAAENLTYERFNDFIAHLFDRTYVEGIVYGDINEQQAQHLTSELLKTVGSQPYPKHLQHQDEVVPLPQEEGPFHMEAGTTAHGNVLILTIELDDFSAKSWAAQEILMRAIEQPFFNELRTKQQTGYIVLSRTEDHDHHLFNSFAVQSNTHSGHDLLQRFEKFIASFLQDMTEGEVTPERFNNLKETLLASLKQPPQSMEEMAVSLEKLAFYYDGDFDMIEKHIRSVEKLTYKEFIERAQMMLGKDNKRRLAVILSGTMKNEG